MTSDFLRLVKGTSYSMWIFFKFENVFYVTHNIFKLKKRTYALVIKVVMKCTLEKILKIAPDQKKKTLTA